jgi:hypothetical protein
VQHQSTGNFNEPFKTIQFGIDTVVAGGTVLVAAGEYQEALSINKSLTLLGANADESPNTGTRGNESIVNGLTTITGQQVVFNGFVLTNTIGANVIKMQPAAANIRVANNIVEDVGTATTNQNVHSIYLDRGPDNVTIEDNLFTGISANGKSASAIAVLDTASTDSSDEVIIRNNTITGVNSTDWGAYGVIVNNKEGTKDLIIAGNTINDLEGLWAHAISLDGPTPNAEATNNIIDNVVGTTYDGAGLFFEDNPDGGSVTVKNNSFSNVAYGVAIHPKHLSGGGGPLYDYDVNAEENWWGDASGPSGEGSGTGVAVSPQVLFDPWYVNALMTQLSNYVPPVPPVDPGPGPGTGFYNGLGMPAFTPLSLNPPGNTGDGEAGGPVAQAIALAPEAPLVNPGQFLVIPPDDPETTPEGMVSVQFILEGSAEELEALLSTYEAMLAEFDTNWEDLTDSEYAYAFIDLSVAWAALQLTEARLSGNADDLTEAVAAYQLALENIANYGDQIADTHMEVIMEVMAAIAEQLEALGAEL